MQATERCYDRRSRVGRVRTAMAKLDVTTPDFAGSLTRRNMLLDAGFHDGGVGARPPKRRYPPRRALPRPMIPATTVP